MSKLKFLTIGLVVSSTSMIAQHKLWRSSRPDGHASISIMSDHYHKKGELMFSYRYMPMWMNGNLSNSNNISQESIFNNYMVAPKKMQMDMQMLGFMYGLSDKLTLMMMANYISNSMSLETRTGKRFTTQSDGFGDVSISTLIKIFNKNRQSFHTIIGLSIPTGSTKHHDDTPMKKNSQLAYPMQTGSGTWDPFFGINYLGQSNKFSWGGQSTYKLRIGKNSQNYSFGNQFDIVGWGAIKCSNYLSFSTSIRYFNTQKIKDTHPNLSPMMPLLNTNNSGKSELDLGIGSNFYISNGRLKNLRLGIEIKFPLAQNVHGIQMKNQMTGTFGIQYTIGK